MWIQRHAITIMFNRTTIFNQNHTCLKVDPISLKVNPLQYLWSQKGERTSMRTMELKCIHQNTLSTCAGKDHCQEMQKQNHKRSVCLDLVFFWLVGFFVCSFALLAFADTHRESASFLLQYGILAFSYQTHPCFVSCLCGDSNVCTQILHVALEMLVKYCCLEWLHTD